MQNRENECACCRYKEKPRSEEAVRSLQNRLNRAAGQINGIKRMIDEGRYCGDILVQLAAVQSALEALGYAILDEHMHSCVADGIREGNTQIIDEAMELIKRLK